MECGTGVRTPTRGIRILAILIESGMIYILIGVSFALAYKCIVTTYFSNPQVTVFTAVAVLFFLHLNHGALSNVFIPVCTQLVVRSIFSRIIPELY
jgi:hypothetical protein